VIYKSKTTDKLLVWRRPLSRKFVFANSYSVCYFRFYNDTIQAIIVDWKAVCETVMTWCVQDEVNQEESRPDEVGGTKAEADFAGEVMHIKKNEFSSVI